MQTVCYKSGFDRYTHTHEYSKLETIQLFGICEHRPSPPNQLSRSHPSCPCEGAAAQPLLQPDRIHHRAQAHHELIARSTTSLYAKLLHELCHHTHCTSLIGSITMSRRSTYSSVTVQPMQTTLALCYLHLAVVLAMLVALNPLFQSACVLAILTTTMSMHAWRIGPARTLLLVVRGPLYLLPVVLVTLFMGSVVCQESTLCLVFTMAMITMAMIPAALLPHWRLVELDDGSTPLPPGYKAWWRAHRRLLERTSSAGVSVAQTNPLTRAPILATTWNDHNRVEG